MCSIIIEEYRIGGLNMEYYYLIFFISIAITGVAQAMVSSRYNKYKKVRNEIGMTGENVARNILDQNGLYDIAVVPVKGNLSDNYNPKTRTVNLSEDIFYGTTVASMAIAAHECGHAIQHKEGYSFMKMRSALVPVVNAASTLSYFSIFVGFIFGYIGMLEIGIVVQFIALLFELVTLPVEFNASSRALIQLDRFNLFSQNEVSGSKKMLFAAAMTYVAALITTLLNLLRLVLLLNRRRD